MSKCKYWNEEHQDCTVSNNTYEQGYNDALDDFANWLQTVDFRFVGTTDKDNIINMFKKEWCNN